MRLLAAIAAVWLAVVAGGLAADTNTPAFSAKLTLPFQNLGTNDQPVAVGVLTAFRPSAAVTWMSKEHAIGYGASLELPFFEFETWHLKTELGITYTTCQVLTTGKLYGKTYQLVGVGLATELRSLVGGPQWTQNIVLFAAVSQRVDDPKDYCFSLGTGVRF